MTVFENEETEMAAAVESHLAPYYPVSVYLREHRRTNRRTDGLVARVDTDAIERRINQKQPPIHYGVGEYLSLSDDEPIKLSEHLSDIAINLERQVNHIQSLAHGGLIEFDDKGRVHTQTPESVIDTLIAFEYKRFDSETAIEQAKERLSYVDYSYVVMDADHTQKAKKLFDEVESPRIGLMEADKDETRVLRHPTQTNVQSSYDLVDELVYHIYLHEEHPDRAEECCPDQAQIYWNIDRWEIW